VPILGDVTPAPSQVIAVVDACKLDCPTTVRSDLYAAISALEMDQPAHGAWLALGKACPAAMGTPGKDGRYASGAWFALHQIGRALAKAHKTPQVLRIQLPLWSQIGTGFELPQSNPGDRLDDPGLGPDVITLTTADAFLGGVSRGEFVTDGFAVEDEYDWPGSRTEKKLPGDLAVPFALPAKRLIDAVSAMTPLRSDDLTSPMWFRFLVTPPRNEVLFGGEVARLYAPIEVAKIDDHGAWLYPGALLIAPSLHRAGMLDDHGRIVISAKALPSDVDALIRHAGDHPVFLDRASVAMATDVVALLAKYPQLGIVGDAIVWPAVDSPLNELRVALRGRMPLSP
jgi:hypothetical protein